MFVFLTDWSSVSSDHAGSQAMNDGRVRAPATGEVPECDFFSMQHDLECRCGDIRE